MLLYIDAGSTVIPKCDGDCRFGPHNPGNDETVFNVVGFTGPVLPGTPLMAFWLLRGDLMKRLSG